MLKGLIAYFSPTGTTAQVARLLGQATGADFYEIKAEVPYTPDDLDWHDRGSRSTLEMKVPGTRPAIAGPPADVSGYDVIFLGFPIWWYVAPQIIHTFLESFDLTGKTIVPFATSDGSDMGETNKRLQLSCEGAHLVRGRVFNGPQTEERLRAWVEGLNL